MYALHFGWRPKFSLQQIEFWEDWILLEGLNGVYDDDETPLPDNSPRGPSWATPNNPNKLRVSAFAPLERLAALGIATD